MAEKVKKNEQSEMSHVNRYTMTVDINGYKYNHGYGTRMEYTELSDYWNNSYPVRVLKIQIPFTDVQGIVHSEKKNVNNRPMYDINIMVKPLDKDGFQNKPFVDGAFKGIMKDGDYTNDVNQEFKPDSRMLTRELGEVEVEMVFYLYKEEELKYSQGEINLVMNNPTLSQAWLSGFSMSNPGMKAICSKFEHNPPMGMLVIPPSGYPDFMQFLDDEAGFFNTPYMDFIEHGVYFLLNRDNDVKCKNAKLEYMITFTVGRNPEKPVDKYIRKLDEMNYEMSVSAADLNITVSNNKSFGQSIKFIPPSGQGQRSDRGLSRNYDVVFKTTEVPHIQMLENPVYENIEINLNNNCVNFVTPLTKFSIMDSVGKPRIYRVSGKQTTIVAGQYSTTKIKGFRLIKDAAPAGGQQAPK